MHNAKNLVGSLAILAGFMSTGQTCSGNFVVNGGFETGDFTGWSNDDPSEINVAKTFFAPGLNTTYSVHSGIYAAFLGPYQTLGTLSQTFSDVSGQVDVFSFYLAGDGFNQNSLLVQFDGRTLYSGTNLPAFGYTLFSYSVIGTGSDTISFISRDDPGFLSLDDISVAPSVVPEPSSLFMVGIAGLMTFVSRKHRQRPVHA